jgi:predicted O-methyltransferase YrrM
MATSEFNVYMAELYQSFQAHDADQDDRLLRYRNIEPESAYYLSMLVRIQQPERLLEIGTSTDTLHSGWQRRPEQQGQN